MAKIFTRGITYQWKAKDLANAWEYVYGVANIVIQCYNKRLLKCRGSRGIEVPEQKRDIVKTLKMLRLRVFWPPWLAPYLLVSTRKLTHQQQSFCISQNEDLQSRRIELDS